MFENKIFNIIGHIGCNRGVGMVRHAGGIE